MKFLDNLKILGHPIIKFGEKYNNIEVRFNFLDLLFSQDSIENMGQSFQVKNSISTEKLKNKFFFFSKIESRKKKYQLNKKIKEFILSYKTIELCMKYETLNWIKLINYKNSCPISLDSGKKIYHPLKDISGKKVFCCFQKGETGLFSIKAPNIILLDSIKKKKTHILNSKLLKINLFSPHPDFPFSFIVSGKKYSEFWRFFNYPQKISINYLYHKDQIVFQKYRQQTKLIDFGTLNMKWKCFDQVIQKYTFFHQFSERIRNISTNFNDSLTAVSTINYTCIFDNRIGKKISTLKIGWKPYQSIEWSRDDSHLILSGKKVEAWNYEQPVVLIKNKAELKNCEKLEFQNNSNLLFYKDQKNIKIINQTNKNFGQSINSKKNIESLVISNSGSLMALNNKWNIKIFQLR